MRLTELNPTSFYGKNNYQTLKKELVKKDLRIKQLEKENRMLKRQQTEDSWQKIKERDVAERTICEDLGSLWD